MECNRAAVTCGDGKYAPYCVQFAHWAFCNVILIFVSKKLFIKHVPAIQIASMAVKDATTQFASAM